VEGAVHYGRPLACRQAGRRSRRGPRVKPFTLDPRGADMVDVTEPVVYRLREVVQVYGSTVAELIREEFGDGIMSAIDFELSFERHEDPKGDRVRLVLDGKFLPYRVY
jgi:cyanate lyase